MNRPLRRIGWIAVIAWIAVAAQVGAADRIPVTTSSDQARTWYLQGRTLVENLRMTDSREYFRKAVDQDADFALAQLALAQTSTDTNEFWTSLAAAVALAPRVSETERHMILGFEAGARDNPAAQKEHYAALAALAPDDERALSLLAGYYYGSQEYVQAIGQFERAVQINPRYAAPYNQLGYLYWFTAQYPKAEAAFRKYTELLPDEANPYDSYAEFLMKMGRFEESIQAYEKALSLNPNFISSYAGICCDRIFLGDPEAARSTCDRLETAARTVGEKRQANFWRAASYLYEGRTPEAIIAVRKMSALSEEGMDLATVAEDMVMIGTLQLESGKPDEALGTYRQAMEGIERAAVPDETKAAARRNLVYFEARVALAQGEIAGAKARVEQFRKLASEKQIPFEMRRSHELAGRLALAEKNPGAALSEAKLASQTDPQVLYLQALACRDGGDTPNAVAFCEQAANFNAMNLNYAFVRKPAKEMLERLRPAR